MWFIRLAKILLINDKWELTSKLLHLLVFDRKKRLFRKEGPQ